MRIPSIHQHNEIRENTSMTPMIDVVFLLLVFFVCAAAGQVRETILATEFGAGSEESPETVEEPPPLDDVTLILTRESTGQTVTTLKGREYTDHAELRTNLVAIAELAPEIPVILDISGDVPFGDVIQVYDTCRAARFETINFATEALPEKKPLPPTTL